MSGHSEQYVSSINDTITTAICSNCMTVYVISPLVVMKGNEVRINFPCCPDYTEQKIVEEEVETIL